MSEKLRELQQGLKEEGADSFRRQVRKLGINALKALASELCMSVEGIRLKEEVRKPGLCEDRSARICCAAALCRAKRWHTGSLDAAQGAEGSRYSCHCARAWLADKRSQGRIDEKAFRLHFCTGFWHHWCGLAVKFVSPSSSSRPRLAALNPKSTWKGAQGPSHYIIL